MHSKCERNSAPITHTPQVILQFTHPVATSQNGDKMELEGLNQKLKTVEVTLLDFVR